ncbi:hypothetical protein Y032_0078g1178 [Ancylostoma ceylanicum]|uniref:Uncharacterized protein n=1 Tax=Ancylostoma ceylanicum TaxID=53326 RepID=A0A016TSV3_9BILA|nr:hypothetical protein Y032_0078g1178 [Ancylostoma ceylanicum]
MAMYLVLDRLSTVLFGSILRIGLVPDLVNDIKNLGERGFQASGSSVLVSSIINPRQVFTILRIFIFTFVCNYSKSSKKLRKVLSEKLLEHCEMAMLPNCAVKNQIPQNSMMAPAFSGF